MIFYKNLKKHKTTSEKNLVFSIFDDGVVSNVDDSVSQPAQCKEFYNLTYSDGALKTGFGFQDLRVPASYDDLENCHTFDFSTKMTEIDGLWFNRYFHGTEEIYHFQLLMIDADFKMYGVELMDTFNGFVFARTVYLESYPTCVYQYRINGGDGAVIFSNEGMVSLTTSSLGKWENVPAMISCVVHYDKFFGITNANRNMLVYTSNLNLYDWTEAESSTIEFLDDRGVFNKLVAFNDYVYLFREHGITKISLYTSKDEFSFTHLYTSPSLIYENSVCVCGDKVFFMTRDGLHTFNGNSVEKVAENCDRFFKNLDNSNCASACLNGKYYLATKCDFADGETVGCESKSHTNNVLFEVDVENFDLNIYRGVDIRHVVSVDCPFMSKICCCFYDSDFKLRIGELTHDGKTFSNATEKKWTSFETDLGYVSKRKKIKEIVLTTASAIEVEIKSDEETKTFKFSGSAKQQRMSVSVLGKIFQFSFKTDEENCDIKKPVVVFDVVE